MSSRASITRTLAGMLGLLAASVVVAQNAAAPVAPKPSDASDDVVIVEADGEGTSKDLALKAALRAALEKGGKQEIFSDSKVENFQLMHDTIITRAQGIVKDYKIVKEQPMAGGTFKVWIKAQVSKSALAKSWEVQNVLKQMGRPKILVCINERIDKELEEQSILETNIEERLLKSGFDLVADKAVRDIRRKESADAAAENNAKKLQAIAKEAKAQIYIVGTANANQAGIEEPVPNVPIAFYNCDAQVKVYYTDSGDLLASKGLPNTRGGARGRKEYSPQAGKMALSNATDELVNDLYEQIMIKWATAISAGGDLTLEVEGLRFKEANQLKKLIAEKIQGVSEVNMEMTQGIPRYRIKATMGGQDLAEKLSEGEFEKIMEIVDVKLNRIQAKAASK